MRKRPLSGINVVGVLFLLLMGVALFLDRDVAAGGGDPAPTVLPAPVAAADGVAQGGGGAPTRAPQPTRPGPPSANSDRIAAPYATYQVTQGLHGASYGHMAVDLSAGKGATILSPIAGVVTERYVDQWGNPTLVIENDTYQVTMLHGSFSVADGQRLQLGDPVGTESNQGYVLDMQGNPCQTQACGYHTHLNVFDRRLGTNVNPLPLIRGQGAGFNRSPE